MGTLGSKCDRGRARFVLVSLLLLPAVGAADPWPGWRGPRRDGISTETGLLDTWPPAGPPSVWSTAIGSGYSSCAIAHGRLFTMDRVETAESVRCFDAATGSELWAFAYPCDFTCEEGDGPRGTPTVDDGHVYAIGAANMLHCLEADTGKVVWKRDLLADFGAANMPWGTSTSPLILGERLFVIPGGADGGSLAALDKRTGATLWRRMDDRAGYSSPIPARVGERTIVLFLTGIALHGVELDGAPLFRYPWETQYKCNIATPIVADGKVFLSSGYDQGCALLDVARFLAGPDAAPDYRNKEMKNHFSTCVLDGGHLYGFNMAFLTCLDFRTGEKRWTQRGFGRGSLTMADGKLIVLGEQGRLALVRPNPDRFEEISSFEALEGRCWTMPVVSDGRLYLRGPNTLRCLDLRR